MRVGIIGAGTAGISCAIESERCGLKPVIFERNDFIGEYSTYVPSMGLKPFQPKVTEAVLAKGR